MRPTTKPTRRRSLPSDALSLLAQFGRAVILHRQGRAGLALIEKGQWKRSKRQRKGDIMK